MKKYIYILIMMLITSCNTSKITEHKIVLNDNQKTELAKKLYLDYEKNLFFVDLYLNGKKAKFLVDTGASVSILDFNQKNRYKFKCRLMNKNIVGVGGSSQTYRALNVKIKTENDKSIPIKFESVDLSSLINCMSKDNLNIVGVIGSDFLMNSKAIINYNEKTLNLYTML